MKKTAERGLVVALVKEPLEVALTGIVGPDIGSKRLLFSNPFWETTMKRTYVKPTIGKAGKIADVTAKVLS